MMEIEFPVIPRMWNCFGTFGDSAVLTSIAKLRHREKRVGLKYGLFKRDAFGYTIQPESKFLDRLLLAYGMLCLECRIYLLYSFVTKKNWS